jgi:hypothetical protein
LNGISIIGNLKNVRNYIIVRIIKYRYLKNTKRKRRYKFIITIKNKLRFIIIIKNCFY